MKILVFGAGVLGCNLARNFFRAGKDVKLLARGSWAEDTCRKWVFGTVGMAVISAALSGIMVLLLH